MFLPAGYPHSVTDDYLECACPSSLLSFCLNYFQLHLQVPGLCEQPSIRSWVCLILEQDSLQAFSSSIANLLSSRAVLQGETTTTNASVTHPQASASAMLQPRPLAPFS